MTDLGELSVDLDANGAARGSFLRLLGVFDSERSRRVLAGLRADPRAGEVAVFTLGKRLARLYTTGAFQGRLLLRGETDHPEFATEFFDALWAGTAHGGPGKRWGFLNLAVLWNGALAGNSVEVGTDGSQRRGSVRVYDPHPTQSRGFAILEVDDEGPILFMSDGVNTITISPLGIQQGPDKAGIAPVPEVDLGGVPVPPEREPLFAGFDVNFVADHPTDPVLQIHYNVLEGPEVGVYARGTAELVDGIARVQLPEHFAWVASDRGMTAQLTPRSANSMGVAATLLSTKELEIRELHRGRGTYQVDWSVHGVRRGRDGFAVVRPKRPAVRRPAARPRREGPMEESGD
jgi:hypothetical protein